MAAFLLLSGAALAVGSPSIAHIRRIPLRIGRNLPSFRQEWSKSPRDWKNYVKYEDILNADPLREGQGSAISQGKESDLSDLDRIGITSDDKDSEWAIRFDDAKGGEVTMILMHESHAPGYYRVIETNRAQLEVWLPSFRRAYKDLDQTFNIVRQEVEWMHKAKCLRWSVFLDGNFKGNIGLNVIDWKNRVGYLGYWLSNDAQGRGIATKAVNEVCRIGFDVLGLEHMDISARKQNAKSAAVAKRLGFQKQNDIEDNEPGIKFPLDVYTLSAEGAKQPAEIARQEFFLVNAMG
ncbi:hypothetical protein AAMO2058_001071300 [Amorphochlora amoebiformis]